MGALASAAALARVMNDCSTARRGQSLDRGGASGAAPDAAAVAHPLLRRARSWSGAGAAWRKR